jgi:hypothetical protein
MAVKKPKKTTTTTKPKTTKKNSFTLDRKSGRWRNNGRFSPAPKKSQLPKDSKGRPLDALGKRVPIAAIAPAKASKPAKRPSKPREPTPKPRTRKPAPAAKPAPKPSRKPRKPAPKPGLGKPPNIPRPPKHGGRRARVEYVDEGQPLTSRLIASSTFENKAPPTHAGTILERVVGKLSKRAGRDPDRVAIYRHGVSFTNTLSNGNDYQTGQLVEKMATEYPHLSFQYNGNNVNVSVGNERDSTDRDEAANNLDGVSTELEDIHAYLYDLWDGDLGWFTYFENDDLEGY